MKRKALILIVLCCVICSWAQTPVAYDKGIHSLNFKIKGECVAFPVLTLNGDDILEVSFDDMTHEFRRFSYRIEHVGADFVTDEGLFDSEYMESDDSEIVIEDYQPSLNTTVLYNHYTFRIPNVGMRPLLSGNYRIVVNVEDVDGDLQSAFEAYFAVVDQRAGILLSGSTDTDIDHHDAHQQLKLEVDYRRLTLRDPLRELKVVVRQNSRWDNAAEWPKSTSNTGHSLKWDYCKELIFPAGNEFRKFEQISTRYSGMHVDFLRYYEPYYYVTLMQDEPRENYLYDEDQNGTFVYRADGSGDPDTEADYMWVLFSIAMEPLADQEVYVNGAWTGGRFDPRYKMKYNAEHRAYECLVFLKQGYYSYQYLCVPHGGSSSGNTERTEGNYFQTENEYTVLVYYRPTGGRYDQLVGWRESSYRPK